MWLGMHLPLTRFPIPMTVADQLALAELAGQSGVFSAIAVSDHISHPHGWKDGLVMAASIAGRAPALGCVTSAALPVLRGTPVLAGSLRTLNEIYDGRLIAGIAAGSSAEDYSQMKRPFQSRWKLFEESISDLRAEVGFDIQIGGALAVPVWIASWGASQGLRRAARYGDGMILSGYNASIRDIPKTLAAFAQIAPGMPVALSTVFLRICDDETERAEALTQTARLLGRSVESLENRTCIGSTEQVRDYLLACYEMGLSSVLVWLLADEFVQVQRLAALVNGDPTLSSAIDIAGVPWANPKRILN